MVKLDTLNRVILFLENGILPELENCYTTLGLNYESCDILTDTKALIKDLNDEFSENQDSDYDDSDDDKLPDYCAMCGREYDLIDREYQICHICKHQNLTQTINNHQSNNLRIQEMCRRRK